MAIINCFDVFSCFRGVIEKLMHREPWIYLLPWMLSEKIASYIHPEKL